MNESVIRCGNTKKRAKQSVNLKLRLQLLAKALQYDARGLQGAITAHTIFFFYDENEYSVFAEASFW